MSPNNPYYLEQNVVIRACAGAGKTYTLAWRYMVILDDFADKSQHQSEQNWLGPKNILAITLTRRDPSVIPQIFVRDVELDIKYLLGKNFHRGQDPDLGEVEISFQ